MEAVAVWHEPVQFADGVPIPVAEFEADAQTWLADVLPEPTAGGTGPQVTARTERGDPAGVLLDHALRADLLVLGNHGRGALGRRGAGLGGPALRPSRAVPGGARPRRCRIGRRSAMKPGPYGRERRNLDNQVLTVSPVEPVPADLLGRPMAGYQAHVSDQPSLLSQIGRGVVASVIGTTAMTAFQKLVEMPITGRDESDAPAQFAEKVLPIDSPEP